MDELSVAMDPTIGYVDKQSEPIKLFVGQIPKTWEEAEVKQVLEPFGPIQELSILKDRTSGVHKGMYPAAIVAVA